MISVTCSSCQKKLSVKDELAGKKGRCPGCGKVLVIPQSADARLAGQVHSSADSREEIRTIPPAPPAGADERTLPPRGQNKGGQESLSDAGGQTSLGGSRPGEPTASQATQGPSRDLWDFLAPAEQPDEIGRLGGFRILKVLGAGGMGVVFQAEDPRLERKLAIKAMLPTLAASDSARKRFLREAKTAAAIEHDHIVPILQVGEDRGVPFIAMPFLKGEPLDERLKRDEVLPVAEVVKIGREAARGLAAAHVVGLVHRDIKPANLWLETLPGEETSAPGYRVKILDFGLARAAADNTHLTQQGAIIGTPAYMAPEQGAGEVVDHRCDLFSLGCVLYRLCAGRMPFKGKDTVSTLVSVATDHPQAPAEIKPNVPAPLSDLVMELLAKKPEDRPQSARLVVERLAALGQDSTTHVTKPGTASPSPRPRATTATAPASRKRRWLWPVAAAAALLLLVPITWLATRGRQPSVETQQPEPLPATFTNSLGMEFVIVPKGKSWLGGESGKPGDTEVEVKENFYLGRYEVTQAEWDKLMGTRPSNFTRTGEGKDAVKDVPDADLDRFPVESVTWEDAQEFLKRLNERDKQADWVYRLPKEAEWEYACRGGPMSDKLDSAFHFYFGKPVAQLQPDQANFEHGKGLKRTCKVGSYPPNKLGLHDMHGNVWEWCDDEHKEANGASRRVGRGGGWDNTSGLCTATFGLVVASSYRNDRLGLRVARVPVGKEPLAPETSSDKGIRPGDTKEIDLLKLIDVKKHAVTGNWYFDGLTLVTPSTKEHTPKTLQVPIEPPQSYELELIVTKLPNNPTMGLVVGIPVGVGNVLALLEEVSGGLYATALHFIDGNRAFWYNGKIFTERKPARIIFKVSQEGFIITCDEKEIIKWKGDSKSLSAGDWPVPNKRQLSVGTIGVGSGYHISKMVLRPVGGIANKAPATTFKNSLGMEFILVPKGKSWLGGGGGKAGDKEVEFKEDFYLGKYEVTQEEWAKVMGTTPSYFSRAGGGNGAVVGISDGELKRFPVEAVSWDDAQLFLKELNKRDKQEGWVYRLPTEAEWEYARRGGPLSDKRDSAFDFYFDKPVAQLQPEHANFGTGMTRTCKVGSYQANKLGLYDMHGNVWEWCEDEQKVDRGASPRVHRGGGWDAVSGACRAAYRHAHPPSFRDGGLGLRVARVPAGAAGK
jgi:formylglycine-generating enzyme required for sulfatase activity